MVKGTLYATAGTRRAVVALDPRTGEQKWMYSMDEGERATRWAPRQLSGRGLRYWTDGKGDERVLYVTTGYRLVALNAKNGVPDPGFGQNGVVDLKVGIMINGKQADLEKSEIGLHSTATIVGDLAIVGSSMFEGLGYVYSTNVKGNVRAFDVRTGKKVWQFDTMPGPGQPGHETWEGGSWNWTGNTGVWTQITADPEAGLVYLPVESPTIDEYGGNRLGDNLYAESLVAVDLKTGKYKWHFQFVHHPIWDHDMSSAPLLVDTTVEARRASWSPCPASRAGSTPSIASPASRSGRSRSARCRSRRWGASGRPRRSRSSTKPPAYSRTHVAESDLIDFTPELRKQVLENLKHFRWEQTPYVPPTGPESPDKLGAINIANWSGGVNWPGSGFDPETGIFYTQAGNSAVTVGHYDKEEFDKVNPEQFKNKPRLPRWEADPELGPAAGAGRSARELPRVGGPPQAG